MVSDPELELTVRPAPGAACEARRALASSRLVESDQEPTLLLLVSELVTNSVRHADLRADEPIRLRARSGDDCTYVEVCDTGRSGTVPNKREPAFDELQPGGLGLMLVDEMADRWGVSCSDGRTCVWFELACAA
jgi:anti-sigma regulatory factor (Ser/Thr protein kinase)